MIDKRLNELIEKHMANLTEDLAASGIGIYTSPNVEIASPGPEHPSKPPEPPDPGAERPPESPRGYRLPNGEVPGMWDIICGCRLCRRIRGLPERETHPDAPCPECQSNVGCDCEPRF